MMEKRFELVDIIFILKYVAKTETLVGWATPQRGHANRFQCAYSG